MFVNRSHRSELVVVIVAVLAVAMAFTVFVTDVDAIDGETIEYKQSSSNNLIIYDSPALDDLIGDRFTASVKNSSGEEFASDAGGNTYFAAIDADGCKISFDSPLEDGLYTVHIVCNGMDLYSGPFIKGDATMSISVDEITVGETVSFKDLLEVSPESLADDVEWVSSDSSVLRVTDAGVEAISTGPVVLTAKFPYVMGDITAFADITVNPIKVSSVTLSSDSEENSVRVGESMSLNLVVDKGASGYTVNWTASSEGVVGIVPSGAGSATVTGLQPVESVTITVTVTNYDGSTVTGTHSLKVEKVSVSSVEITTEDGLELGVGGTVKLDYSVNPENATNKAVTWSSSDTTVAMIDEDGTVHGLKEGTVTITVTSSDNPEVSDTCSLKVAMVHVESVTLDKTQISLEVGESVKLTANVNPNTAGNKAVTWDSSDESVVTVKNGVVTAVGLGKATITVVTADGGKTATCAVEVIEETFAVTFESDHGTVTSSSGSVAPNGSITFTITPDDGYKIDSVTVGGTPIVSVDGVYEISNITSDVIVLITYVPDVPDVPDDPDYPVIPPYNPDDDYVPIPPTIVDNRSDDDDATKIVACAAAAVAAAILAAFIIMEYRKR